MHIARIEPLAAAALVAATVGLVFSTRDFPADSRIFPLLVLAALLVAAIAWLIRSIVSARNAGTGSDAPAVNYRTLLTAAAVTFAYGVGVWLWSFFLPTVLYIPLMAFVLGNRNLVVTITSSIGFAIGVYIIFVWLFERPIPLF